MCEETKPLAHIFSIGRQILVLAVMLIAAWLTITKAFMPVHWDRRVYMFSLAFSNGS
jgi:hypothetical protein